MAAPAFVRETPEARTTSATSVAMSFATLPAVGNHIVVAVSSWATGADPGTGSVTDNQSNTYTRVAYSGTTSSERVAIYTCKVATSAGTFTVTYNPTGTGDYTTARAYEYSGANATTWVEGGTGTSQTGAATNFATPGLTPTNVDDRLFAVFGHGGANDRAITENAAGTVGTWSLRWEQEDVDSGQPISLVEIAPGNTTTRQHNWSISSTGDLASCIVALMPATAATASIPPGLIIPRWRRITRRVYR